MRVNCVVGRTGERNLTDTGRAIAGCQHQEGVPGTNGSGESMCVRTRKVVIYAWAG